MGSQALLLEASFLFNGCININEPEHIAEKLGAVYLLFAYQKSLN